MVNRPAPGLLLREGDRGELEALVRSRSARAGLVRRARIVLLAADGLPNTEIAHRVGASRTTVIAWRGRYQRLDMEGLEDAARPGRPRKVDHTAIVTATLTAPPKSLGVAHWSTRLLAARLGVSAATVARAWRAYGIKPWREQSFRLPTDPELVGKVTDICGLYLGTNPDVPDNAIVLCVGREVPDPGTGPHHADPAHAARADRAPQQRLHPAPRHHPVRGAGGDRHRQGPPPGPATATRNSSPSCDRWTGPTSTPSTPTPDNAPSCTWSWTTTPPTSTRTRSAWLEHHPHIHVHHTPTHASWMNLMEVWFSLLERQAIRRGVFKSGQDLNNKLRAYITGWNKRAHPFTWTKTAEQILTKANRPETNKTRH